MSLRKKFFFTLSNILAGIISGFITVIISVSVIALIFTGPLQSYFSLGITTILIGTIIVNTILAIKGSFPVGIGRSMPAIGALFGVIAQNLINLSMEPSLLVITLIVLFAISSGLTGLTMFLLGYFKLGQMVRFLPYPVLGGVIVGVAWIMFRSSFYLLNNHLTLEVLIHSPNDLMKLIIALGFAFFLLLMIRNKSNWSALPLSIILFSLIINIFLYSLNSSYEQIVQSGWLFATYKPTFFVSIFDLSSLQKIQPIFIIKQSSYILSIVALSIILFLLGISGLENLLSQNADEEKELKIAGIANILSAIVGSPPSSLSMSGTLLNQDVGANNRISGITASIVCLLVLFLAPEIISYLPIPLTAGLLIYTSINIFIQWLYQGFYKLQRIDYLTVVTILLITVLWNFLAGMLVGIIITCIVFIVYYSKTEVVNFFADGTSYQSNVIRPSFEQNWLSIHGCRIQYCKLQGFLFFGSTKLLLDKILQMVNTNQMAVRYLILEFNTVSGIDSSAAYNFLRLKQLISPVNVQLIFAGCSNSLYDQLKQQEILISDQSILLFETGDEALEWAEQQVIALLPKAERLKGTKIHNILTELFPLEEHRTFFVKYLEVLKMEKKDILFHQGKPSDCLYFIDSGHVSVYLHKKNSSIRLSKSGAGTIIGEIGFYLHIPRTASVLADTDCVIYKFTQEAMVELEKDHPDIALMFHKKIIKTLADRLSHTNQMLRFS